MFPQTKEEVIGTLEAVQALQVQNGHLQKAREGYHAKCTELERLRKEGAPQKELEKVCVCVRPMLLAFMFNGNFFAKGVSWKTWTTVRKVWYLCERLHEAKLVIHLLFL